MKATFENLHKTERQIRQMFYNSRNSEYFLETVRGMALSDRWDRMMIELRGYGRFSNYEDRGRMKQSWIDHCNEIGFVPNYDLSDVMC
jgi:tRNA splicing ligase